MDEQQVRALVRQAIARHMGAEGDASRSVRPAAPESRPSSVSTYGPAAPDIDTIVSARFHLARPENEVECLIEPAVMCNHCGYCQCYGH